MVVAGDGPRDAVGVPVEAFLGVHGDQITEILGRTLELTAAPETETEAGDDRTLRIGVVGGDDVAVFVTPAPADEHHGAGTWVYLARSSHR